LQRFRNEVFEAGAPNGCARFLCTQWIVGFGVLEACVILKEIIVGVGINAKVVTGAGHDVCEYVEAFASDGLFFKGEVGFFLWIVDHVVEFKKGFVLEKVDDEFVRSSNKAALEIAECTVAIKLHEDVFTVERVTGFDGVFKREAFDGRWNLNIEKIA